MTAQTPRPADLPANPGLPSPAVHCTNCTVFSLHGAMPPMKNGGPRKGAAAFLSGCRRDQKAQRAPIEATRAEPSAVPRRCEVVAAGVPP